MTLYQPFLDYAIELLPQRLDLKPYPIPEGFATKSAIVGKGKQENEVVTTSYGYQSPHLNYDLPFFGADLVTLPGGHLIALDMQPLFRDDLGYQAKYSQPIMPIFEKYQQHLAWGGDFPAEASAFFSPAFLWTRPQATEAVETHVFGAFKEYLQAYLDFVDRAEPVTDPQALEAIKQSQLRYLRYRAEKDPARGMFNRFYGSEWTEEYIHGFLFDLERKLATVS
jgi:phycoerythrobilin:ferredoxin oxidoreductase